ncbi:MAG TPA: hypothetical protein VI300_26570 [Solirubrobacter sp.]|nr:hypothetical protein [Anaeromyxobacteraceae bacterium]
MGDALWQKQGSRHLRRALQRRKPPRLWAPLSCDRVVKARPTAHTVPIRMRASDPGDGTPLGRVVQLDAPGAIEQGSEV